MATTVIKSVMCSVWAAHSVMVVKLNNSPVLKFSLRYEITPQEINYSRGIHGEAVIINCRAKTQEYKR